MIESLIFNKTKNKYQKVVGNSFFCEELNRSLLVHPDIDFYKLTSVSDLKTGYRLFGINCKKQMSSKNNYVLI